MKSTDIPTKFPIPFGNNAAAGTIRTIPQASQTSTSPGQASLYDGFPVATGQPLASGGIPPSMQDFNGLLNQITAWTRWQNAGGIVVFDQTFVTSIGGYPMGAILQSTTAGLVWLNTVDNNTTNPDSGSASGWVGLSPSASKSAFNTQTFATSTRSALSGTTNIVQVWSPGTYNKQSGTSTLRVSLLTTFFTSTGYGPTQANLTIGSTTITFFASCGTSSNPALGQIPFFTVQKGISAGPLSLSFSVQRNDGQSWAASFCPTQAADNAQLPASNPSSLIIEEIGP